MKYRRHLLSGPSWGTMSWAHGTISPTFNASLLRDTVGKMLRAALA